jgi:hypothetical protein
MKNLIVLLLALLVVSGASCTPPTTTPARPDYVGTWKGTAYWYGTSTVFNDVTIIVDENNFEIDIYNYPTDTTLQTNSIKGTHGTLTPSSVCNFAQTQVYNGVAWVANLATRYIQYSISGTSITFTYAYTNPAAWDIQGTLVKQ